MRSLLPQGFRFSAAACGLKKKKRLDLALITSEAPAAAAAVFTTNRVQAAPVVLSCEHMRRSAGAMRAIVVNSGNANCATGPAGMAAAQATASAVARELGCRPEQVLVCSTGVIGVPLRVERILNALPAVARVQRSSAATFATLTRAIMTTDTRPKWAAAICRIGGQRVRLLGCAKGAGMIHPQMAPPTATMLAFVLTDAAMRPALLQRALNEVVGRTFNAITIDGDTSTNDTLLVLANGASPAPRISAENGHYRRFVVALESVCRELALRIVADGEGARRVVEIEVRGAPSDHAAEQVARTIAGSPLVKTALAGADPNWGRILAAVGRTPLPKNQTFDPARVEIRVAGLLVCRGGQEHPFSERIAHRRLLAPYVPIVVDLGCQAKNKRVPDPGVARMGVRLRPNDRAWKGQGTARIWTCDFTADYVRINASYRT